MKNKTALFAGICLAAAASLPAQTLFSDPLTTASNWSTAPQNLVFSKSAPAGLSYVVASPTANNESSVTLTAYTASSASSWSAQVDVHLDALTSLIPGHEANLNLIVAKSSDANNFITSLAIDRYNAGSGIVQDIDTYVTTGGAQTHLSEVPNPTTYATLMVSYNSVTRQLTYAFDSDGPTNGFNFVTIHTVDISAWAMGPTDSFTFLLVGASGFMNGFGTGVGPVLTSSSAYYQNFVVTAGTTSSGPPTITTQPTTQTVKAGASVTFSVAASGTSPTYQWSFNGTAIGGATSASYVINSTTVANAGSYTVTVTNSAGSVTSNAATLAVTASAVAPSITTQPSSQTVPTGAAVTFTVVASGTLPLSYQWSKNSSTIPGATGSSIMLSNVQASDAGSYSVVVTNGAGSVTASAAQLSVNTTGGAPVITTQPNSQTVVAGGSVSFNAIATGTAPLTYQWQKNGSVVPGATSASYSISLATIASTGSYAVTVTNASGSVTSNGGVLAVQATGAPAISSQPQAQVIAAGSTVVLTVNSNGTVTISSISGPNVRAEAVAATSYQWYLNGVALSGGNSATLLVSNAGSANVGSYSCLVSNSSGSTLSNAAVLTVTTTTNPGRLINLSILAPLAAGETMTMGTVLGGAGTSGAKALLARAGGPSLAQFGITAFLPNPTMTLNSTSGSPAVVVATNTKWGGTTTLSNAFAAVGAFPYTSATSSDSALFQPSLAADNYTVQVSDASGGSGTVIAELYDATPGSAFTATTPRLINVSVLKQIATGSPLTAGFVIGGSTSRTVLIRAVGPRLALAPFNIPGTMPAPTMTLVNTTTGATVATNSGWGGDPQIASVASSVGAFAVTDPTSNDAMLLVTLAPANYTAQVGPASGTAGGIAIVEVYEIP